MKKWIRVLIIVQTVLFSMLIMQLDEMTETIAAVGSVNVTKDGILPGEEAYRQRIMSCSELLL